MAKCKNCFNNDLLYDSEENGTGTKQWFHFCEYLNDSLDIEEERECEFYTPATNAERIRNMTDEELAGLLDEADMILDCKKCKEPINEWGCCVGDCRNEYLRWLQSPVEV